MTVVVRPRPVAVVLGLVASVVIGLFMAADEGDLFGWWIAPVLAGMFAVGALRSRVEISPDRVRIVRTFTSDEVRRPEVVAVYVSEGRRHPPTVALEERSIVTPNYIRTRRIAEALGVPHRSRRHDREIEPQPLTLGTPWVRAVAVVLAGIAVVFAVALALGL